MSGTQNIIDAALTNNVGGALYLFGWQFQRDGDLEAYGEG